MRLCILAILIALIFLLSFCNTPNISTPDVSFERITETRENTHGDTIATLGYDKPIFSSSVEAVDKLNSFFDYEATSFFYGGDESDHFKEGYYNYFFESADATIKRHGGYDTYSGDSPYTLYCTITSIVAFEDDGIISIKQTFEWFVGGVSDTTYYGYTIDLKSGVFLTIDHFTNVDSAAFNEEVIAKLYNDLGQWWDEFDGDQVADTLRSYNFENYEYFIDETGIHVVLNNEIRGYEGYIVILDR